MLVNFILFQIGWFACTLGAAHGVPWVGTGIAATIVSVHLLRAARPVAEAILVAIAAATGLVFDSALVALGWVSYPSGSIPPIWAPHWIVALWMLFATTLNVSLRWLRGKPIVAAALGAVGAPLAYWGGARLGGMEFLAPLHASAVLAIGWAVLTPALIRVAQRFDGYPQPPAMKTCAASPRAHGSSG